VLRAQGRAEDAAATLARAATMFKAMGMTRELAETDAPA
jgi:hypothetical protein